MPEPREPSAPGRVPEPAAGRHGLGPHVVGQRVVVRRLLRGRTGPSGGPAMSDVLGVCLAWSDGVCVVERDGGPDGGQAGDAVRIPVADIVSGKPVPPRTPARGRVDPPRAQRRAFAVFPGMRTEPLGAWVLRRSSTYTARRANSVLAFGPSGLPGGDDEAVSRVLAWYDRPIAAVLSGSAQAEHLLASGWRPESGDADTVFQLASVAAAARALHARPAVDVAVDVVEEGGLVTARVGDDDASGVAAVDGDWVGFRSIAVDAGHRRRGLATAVMAALLERAAEHGATTAYLQVLADNDPALALYAGLGFTDHHRYRYLVPPDA